MQPTRQNVTQLVLARESVDAHADALAASFGHFAAYMMPLASSRWFVTDYVRERALEVRAAALESRMLSTETRRLQAAWLDARAAA